MGSVLLAGELGVRDPGQDALIRAFARELPHWPIVLASADPDGTARRHGRPAVDRRRARSLLGALRACEVLVLGEGALRGSGRETRLSLLFVALIAKALGRRVVVLGVGAGGLRRRAERVRARALVRLSDLLVLRDGGDAEALAAAGAHGPFRVGADPAWLALENLSAPGPRRDEILVVLDARAVPPGSALPARLAATLDCIGSVGLSVRLAPWRVSRYGSDDLDLARLVAGRMAIRARILLPPAGVIEAGLEAARSRAVLALRAHGIVVAASAGTPAVALDGAPGISALAHRLGQPVLARDADPRSSAATIIRAAAGPGPDQTLVGAERAAAREGFRLLRLLLEAQSSQEDHDLIALPLVPEPATSGLAVNGDLVQELSR